jgi:hypothetical protein
MATNRELKLDLAGIACLAYEMMTEDHLDIKIADVIADWNSERAKSNELSLE